MALIYLLFGFVFYVFAHSAFISWLRGNAVLLSQAQPPDLRARFEACCTRLGLTEPPEAYLMQGGGMLNAFATRFLGRNYVVLLSDIVDAMEEQPGGVDFYFGHELGHIRRHHLTGNLLRAPVLWLPLLGAAYARARNTPATGTAGRAANRRRRRRGRSWRWRRERAAGARSTCRLRRPGGADQRLLDVVPRADQRLPWLTKRTVRVSTPRRRCRGAVGSPGCSPCSCPTPAGRAAARRVIIVIAAIGILAASPSPPTRTMRPVPG